MTIRVPGRGGKGKGESRSFRVSIQEGFSEESTFELRLEGALRSEGRQDRQRDSPPAAMHSCSGLRCTAQLQTSGFIQAVSSRGQ